LRRRLEAALRINMADRNRRCAASRAVAWYLLREITGASYPEIGRVTGAWHHTTVMSGVRSVRRVLAQDAALWIEVEQIRGEISA
jgi:chromosomal replication initiator protein